MQRIFKIAIQVVFLFSITIMWSQHDDLKKEIDKIIRYDTDIKYPDHEGFMIGIIDNDSTYILNFGKNEIQTSDIFELGGITKVFTAILAVRLSELGILELDKSINDYLPAEFKNEQLAEYVLSDLLMHQIPFPKRPSDLALKEYDISNPYAYYAKIDLLNYYKSFRTKRKLKWSRKQLDYSHINYALLEVIIESVLKMPYEDALQQYLLEDLKMTSSSTIFPADSITIGYDRADKTPEPWVYQSFSGSEGMASNMVDLLHFLRLNLEIAKNELSPILMHSMEFKKKSKISNKLAHSYAWYILSSRKSGEIYTHSGVTQRHKAYLHFSPRTQTGVVILSRTSSGTGELGMLVLRLINNNWKRK